MRNVSKIAAAAAGLVLVGSAAAAAVTAPPEAADNGLTKAEEKAGFDLPAANDEHPTPEDHPGGGQGQAAEAPEGTHGAEVSAVARDDSTSGREHGEAVSEVARGDHGPEGAGGPVDTPQGNGPAVDTPNPGGTSTADEASDGASAGGTSKASERAALGSGNAGDHGRP